MALADIFDSVRTFLTAPENAKWSSFVALLPVAFLIVDWCMAWSAAVKELAVMALILPLILGVKLPGKRSKRLFRMKEDAAEEDAAEEDSKLGLEDAAEDLDFSETGPRLRCSKLCAQAAGQPPDLPQACTTVVLKNIPTRYMPDTLLAALHECGYLGEIDFLYLPIDFKNSDRNLGFAIMNFRGTKACLKFTAEFHLANACNKFTDAEIQLQRCLKVSPAPLQGSRDNIRHLQKSSVLAWLTEYPAWFPQVLDGSGVATPLSATRNSSSKQPRRLTSRTAASLSPMAE